MSRENALRAAVDAYADAMHAHEQSCILLGEANAAHDGPRLESARRAYRETAVALLKARGAVLSAL